MITNKKNAWRSCNSSKEETLENRKTRHSVMGAFVFIILCQSASCSSADIYQWSSERSLLAVSSHFPDGKSASRGQTAYQRMAGYDLLRSLLPARNGNCPGSASHRPEPCCHCHKTKQRTEGEYKKLMNRLNRIEGQIRGIKGMLEKDAYCTDILVQVAAVNSALNSFNKELLAEHIRTCVIEDIKAGKEDTVDDLVDTIKKLMK